MRVLGIDCGGEYTGYGVVEQDDRGSLHHLCFGAIHLSPREALELRLKRICEGLHQIIAAHLPEQVAIEDVFYAVNAKSALKLGHVRGVAMLRSCPGRIGSRGLFAVVNKVRCCWIRQGREVASTGDGRATTQPSRAAATR